MLLCIKISLKSILFKPLKNFKRPLMKGLNWFLYHLDIA